MNFSHTKKACLPNRQALAITILIITCTTTFAQNRNTVDSLENILKTANIKEKPAILNELAKYYIEISSEKSMVYADTALQSAKKNADKKQEATALKYLGIVFYNKSNYDKALEYYKEALQIFEESNEKKEISIIYSNIGLVFTSKGNYGKAIEFYNNSLEISQKIGDIQGIAMTLNNIGNVYENCGSYEKTIEYYNNSLEISQKIGDKKGIARILNNLGIVYYNWGNYKRAIEYYNNSLEINQKIGDKKGIAGILNNIGLVYNDLSNYEKAVEYYNNSLEIYQKIGDKQGITITLNNIGIVYNNRGNYKKAVEYYNNSLKLSRKIGDKQGIAVTQNNIGFIYTDTGNYKKAIEFFNKSLQTAQSLNLRELIYDNYKGLSEVYSAVNEYEKSLEYYKLYTTTKDSVFNEKSRQQITKLEFRHETEKNENKIKLLKKNQKIQELKFDKEKKIRNTFTIAFILVSGFIFILSYLYIQKQKAYKIIVKHNVELAKKDIEFEKIVYSADIRENKIINKQDETKYSGSVLNETRKQKFLQDIILLMEEEKYFLNPQFTVEDCAKELQTNRKYISQIINEYFNTNFNNFINEYRVKEARKYLVNPDFNNYSLNGIASMAGFHSRATFNTAFKKFTGITPSYFKKKNS